MKAPRNRADQRRLLSLLLLLALVTGGIASWRDLRVIQTRAAGEAARDEQMLVRLRQDQERGRRPTVPAAPVASRAETSSESRVDRTEALKLLADLSEKGLFATPHPSLFLTQSAVVMNAESRRRPRPAYMIDGLGTIDPGFAAFFGLSSAEDEALRTGMRALRDEIDEALRAHTTLRPQEGGALILEVKPVPQAVAYRERFTALIQEVLGAERFRAFATLNLGPGERWPGPLAAHITGDPNFFGENEATYTLTHTPTTYRAQRTFRGPTGNGSGGGGGGLALTPAEFRERMLNQFGSVMKLLPPDF